MSFSFQETNQALTRIRANIANARTHVDLLSQTLEMINRTAECAVHLSGEYEHLKNADQRKAQCYQIAATERFSETETELFEAKRQLLILEASAKELDYELKYELARLNAASALV